MTNKGKLIAASLGPGDPGWITRKSWEALKSTQCWAWPVTKRGRSSYALDIVKDGGLTPPEGSLELVFPMTRDSVRLVSSWQAAAQSIHNKIEMGVDVVFLVEGDASTYATFGYLSTALLVIDESINIEIIPGVTSPLACAARSGGRLVEGDETLAIVPATVGIERIESIIDQFDTVVLLKVKSSIASIVELIAKNGLQKQSVFIERIGSRYERIIEDIERIEYSSINYLSLLIIRPRRIKTID